MLKTQMICRPYITLRNGRVLWAWEVGKKAFCFAAKSDYVKKKNPPIKEDNLEDSQVIEG